MFALRTLVGLFVVVASASTAAPGPTPKAAPWTKVGPSNIGDDIHQNGESGTLADAVSPASNPNLIYAGGSNNGASSGIIKSTDMGEHWVGASTGLFHTNVHSLIILDDKGDHVFCGTAGGVYETTDAARSWKLIPNTPFCLGLTNGTIGGVPHVLCGAKGGIYNVPTANTASEQWSVIPAPENVSGFDTTYISTADSDPKHAQNSVVGGCLMNSSGARFAHIATVISKTEASWAAFPNMSCIDLALDPNDAGHFILVRITRGLHVWETTDGGESFHSLGKNSIYHIGIDRQGWLYTAAEEGAFVSQDKGKTWLAYFGRRVHRLTNQTVDRIPHDYQRISLDFAGGVAFPSDQGLFIKPPGNGTMLIAANGDMNNNIAIKAAISKGDGTANTRYIVTTVWDWSPLGSWDSGAHWPSWDQPQDGAGAGCIGEGGAAFGLGRSNHVLMIHHHNVMHSALGGKNFTRYIPPGAGSVGAPVYDKLVGSRSEPSGMVYCPYTVGKPLPTSPQASGSIDVAIGGDAMVNKRPTLSERDAHKIAKTMQPELGKSTAGYRWDVDTVAEAEAAPINTAVVGVACKAGDPAQSGWVHDASSGHITHSGLCLSADAWGLDLNLYSCGNKTTHQNFTFDATNRHFETQAPSDPANAGTALVPSDLEISTRSDPTKTGVQKAYVFRPAANIPAMAWTVTGGVFSNGNQQCLTAVAAYNPPPPPPPPPVYLLKNHNFGAMDAWNYTLLPKEVADIKGYAVNPENDGILYGVTPSCIARSKSQGETWYDPCWKAAGLTAAPNSTFTDLVIKDSKTMLVLRSGDVALRTQDGGKHWSPLTSMSAIANASHMADYSWSGKTLVLHGADQHAPDRGAIPGYVWVSTDDGDTWVDETADLVTMAVLSGQWYEGTWYLNTAGSGILSKELEPQ